MSSLRDRNLLYARLEEVLGTEPAGILMSHISTETDPATKTDIANLSERLAAHISDTDAGFDRIDARFDRIDTRIDRLEAHMARFDDKLEGFHEALRDQARTYVLTMTGVMASFAAVVVATGILT